MFTITAVSLGRYSIYWVIVDDSRINFIEIINNNLEYSFSKFLCEAVIKLIAKIISKY